MTTSICGELGREQVGHVVLLDYFHMALHLLTSLPAAHLCNGTFHKHLQDLFVPLVVRYIDLMESSIAQSIHRGFEQETWQSVK